MEVDFSDLSVERLQKMAAAGEEVLECQRVLILAEENIIATVLRGSDGVYKMRHYPEGDVYDFETGSQYYYHTHRYADEHGHFHLFLRPCGMPDELKPAPLADFQPPKEENDALSHLFGISMAPSGNISGLFTTNRWVTAEYWYRAQDVIEMLDCFHISHAFPSQVTNRWLTSIAHLFYPQICRLLLLRDQSIADWQEKYPNRNVYEDRGLEIASEISCDIEKQISLIEEELKKRSF